MVNKMKGRKDRAKWWGNFGDFWNRDPFKSIETPAILKDRKRTGKRFLDP